MSCLMADRADFDHAVLDCVFAAHDRHLAGCDELAAFCSDPDLWGDVARARELHRFLTVTLLDHMAEEDDDLLPLLQQRGLTDNDDASLASLAAEHRRDRLSIANLARELAHIGAGAGVARPAALLVGGLTFAHNYRKHVAAEDKALRLIAADLSRRDHDTLRDSMRRRRNRR